MREDELKNQRKAYEAQQEKITHMQEFITKFRCNAKRASLVQSRIKELERMQKIEPVEEDSGFKFHFQIPEKLGRPIISVEGVSFAYSKTTDDGKIEHGPTLFEDVHFSIDMESRIGVVGPNGAGKSTLLNIITDKLRAIDGDVRRNSNLRIGIFTQVP